MMAKKKSVYECIECGYKSAKWMGKCPACGSWDSFIEVGEEKATPSKSPSKILKFEKIEKEEITKVIEEGFNLMSPIDVYSVVEGKYKVLEQK